MKNNQKINLPAVVEDDVSFFHQAAMAMRQVLPAIEASIWRAVKELKLKQNQNQ